MLYLLCFLVAGAALVLAVLGGKHAADPYGKKGILLDAYNGIRFPLPPLATLGGPGCDVDLSQDGYSFRPNEAAARICLNREGEFVLTGRASVLRRTAVIPCSGEWVSLQHNDVLLIPLGDQEVQLTFERR